VTEIKPEDLGVPVADDGGAWEDDLTGVAEGQTFSVLPPGRYPARLVDVSLDWNKARTGKRYEFEFEILAPADVRGQTRRMWVARTVDSRWKVAETLSGLGINAYDQQVRWSRQEVIGKLVVLEVIADEYGGKPTDKIDRVWRLDDYPELAAQVEANDASTEDIPF